MDTVKTFNDDLSSLYEVKPPISKAKMTSITKNAIKAIRFYKHVVQSVEKFIQKCKPEYKVPGLYVIDSIVRQSRHQFSAEKDVFAPRFAKNLTVTFFHMYKCPEEDKSKIVRVLNLWQKNRIYSSEVVQPLLDLVDPTHPLHHKIENEIRNRSERKGSPVMPASRPAPNPIAIRTDLFGTAASSASGITTAAPSFPSPASANVLDPNLLQNLIQIKQQLIHQYPGASGSPLTPQKSETNLGHTDMPTSGSPKSGLNRELFAYDYGDEDSDQRPSPTDSTPTKPAQQPVAPPIEENKDVTSAIASLLSNPQYLQRLQQGAGLLPTTSSANIVPTSLPFGGAPQPTSGLMPLAVDGLLPTPGADKDSRLILPGLSLQAGGMLPQSILPQPPIAAFLPPAPAQVPGLSAGLHPSLASFLPPPTSDFDARLHQLVGNQPSTSIAPLMMNPLPTASAPQPSEPLAATSDVDSRQLPFGATALKEITNSSKKLDDGPDIQVVEERPSRSGDRDSRHKEARESSRDRKSRRRSRSRSRSPRRRSRRSRSRSRDRHRRSRSRGRGGRSRSRGRSRSHSRSRGRDSERDRNFEREQEKERERERERKKKGLPPIKEEHLSICTTTLWVGHLSKLVHEEEISNTFADYGDVVSIDLIPPRGCAFVVMNRRQDAYRALQKLKNTRMQGKSITLAWAPGVGVKGKDFQDYWEADLGVTYIPWNLLNTETDLTKLEEGGRIDDESAPEWVKGQVQRQLSLTRVPETTHGANVSAFLQPPQIAPEVQPPQMPQGLPQNPFPLPMPGVGGGPLLPGLGPAAPPGGINPLLLGINPALAQLRPPLSLSQQPPNQGPGPEALNGSVPPVLMGNGDIELTDMEETTPSQKPRRKSRWSDAPVSPGKPPVNEREDDRRDGPGRGGPLGPWVRVSSPEREGFGPPGNQMPFGPGDGIRPDFPPGDFPPFMRPPWDDRGGPPGPGRWPRPRMDMDEGFPPRGGDRFFRPRGGGFRGPRFRMRGPPGGRMRGPPPHMDGPPMMLRPPRGMRSRFGPPPDVFDG